MVVSNLHVRDAKRGRSLSDYWPLISLVVVSVLAAFAIAAVSGKVTTTSVVHAYMGVFLAFFALLKIFDLEGFMNGFAMYDLIIATIIVFTFGPSVSSSRFVEVSTLHVHAWGTCFRSRFPPSRSPKTY